VLDQDRTPREAQEGPAGVGKVRGADQHRAVDLVAPAGVGVDGRPAVDQGVEEGQRSAQPEALGADLEDQERGVAGGLDVDGDELGFRQRGVRADVRRVDRDLFPRHRLLGAPRLQADVQ